MIVCPNCSHPNPEGATQCEACFTPLPIATSCPNCGAAVQTDATFCGQCGFNLRSSADIGGDPPASSLIPNVPELVTPDPLIAFEPASGGLPQGGLPIEPVEPIKSIEQFIEQSIEQPPESTPAVATPNLESDPLTSPITPIIPLPDPSNKTQLQVQGASLMHVQTSTQIDLPNLTVIHLGKPNNQVPPDIDVSGFPESEIVSRIHADIRVEAGIYYLEDMGSSNGTYVNHNPLPPGNRYRLRAGDRISLGKGDKLTFLFQLA